MGRLIMVRHGESEGNRERRFTVSPAVALTARGREQAHAAAARIGGRFRPTRVIASPYLRARETAGIIAASLGLALDIEPNLHERRFGALAGESYDAREAEIAFDPIAGWFWRPPGGGESWEDVRRRIAPVLDRIAQQNPNHELVVVSHGAVMLTAWAHLSGRSPEIRIPLNCGILLVEYDHGSFRPPVPLED